jgi:hypothetical protein
MVIFPFDSGGAFHQKTPVGRFTADYKKLQRFGLIFNPPVENKKAVEKD